MVGDGGTDLEAKAAGASSRLDSLSQNDQYSSSNTLLARSTLEARRAVADEADPPRPARARRPDLERAQARPTRSSASAARAERAKVRDNADWFVRDFAQGLAAEGPSLRAEAARRRRRRARARSARARRRRPRHARARAQLRESRRLGWIGARATSRRRRRACPAGTSRTAGVSRGGIRARARARARRARRRRSR